MKMFYTLSSCRDAYIYVENGKVIRAHYEQHGRSGGGYNPKREEPDFLSCLRDCMSAMITDDLDKFKRMMNSIEDDTECYEIGKLLLANEKKRIESEAQKYTL